LETVLEEEQGIGFRQQYRLGVTAPPKTDPWGLKKRNGWFWASARKEAAMRKSKFTEERARWLGEAEQKSAVVGG
jgi:hypothetical protein